MCLKIQLLKSGSFAQFRRAVTFDELREEARRAAAGPQVGWACAFVGSHGDRFRGKEESSVSLNWWQRTQTA